MTVVVAGNALLPSPAAAFTKCHDSSRFDAHFRLSRRTLVFVRKQAKDSGSKVEDMMQAKKSADAGSGARGNVTELDDRYAKIGISAVAAAVRYQSDNRDPAPVHASSRYRDE